MNPLIDTIVFGSFFVFFVRPRAFPLARVEALAGGFVFAGGRDGRGGGS